MYGIKNSIHKVYKGAAEAVLPVRSQSRFKEEGVRLFVYDVDRCVCVGILFTARYRC